MPISTAEFCKFVRDEIAIAAKIIKAAGIKAGSNAASAATAFAQAKG